MVDKIIPLSTKEGHQYLIKLESFQPNILPEDITVPVINITIELVNEVVEINNIRTLLQIASEINRFADDKEVILYCYCDKGVIQKRKGKEHISNQQFRSMLFTKMFEKQNQEKYINEKIIIKDVNQGDHYIHLFAKVQNKPTVEVIAQKLEEFNK
ncbi:hypothetical protein GCM10007424_25140 [Flavobacterium suaedae]|uniref:Uncharacterized protein n=1 Tax=Flavobacterium suaedae TaxID=1767027 RepID=A0ABQ1K4Q3_9FLAO|nr:hypothetical protein [Flavobacterium suaedae]GGB84097.1 hypothetical protein GCM10007424_25140 [Flavobacterium suaedae]